MTGDTETQQNSGGRPRKSGGPAIAAASIFAEGGKLAYCDGAWSGTRSAVRSAKLAASLDDVLALDELMVDSSSGLAYVAAIIADILGPVDWTTPLSEADWEFAEKRSRAIVSDLANLDDDLSIFDDGEAE